MEPNKHLSITETHNFRRKAIEDARKTQAAISEECARSGTQPPLYILSELIGKGSFGRVYKASTENSGQLVAVKIISIEEGDGICPGAVDTFKDIINEVNTLKLLHSSGAKNVNTIIDTLLVGQSAWMVTEYCAGGSVSALMRPTGSLAERWIIPILREVAEALYWVHRQGIIHRDVKCANVLVMEDGAVQLCDFGVAGIIESNFDKRSTVTGTLQWMAPELFDSTVSYGTEIDIWAFGSMVFEVATGLPPNATNITDVAQFGRYLKHHCPRLEGDQYSASLKDLVASCMVADPAQRPSVEQVQNHSYIHGTDGEYPTKSLERLVHAYKLWESHGGGRQSLFSAGGAQGFANGASSHAAYGEWDFVTMDFHGSSQDEADIKALNDAYGHDLDLSPAPPITRNRRRPPDFRPFVPPLARIFDSNTITNYGDNVRDVYHRQPPATTQSPATMDSPVSQSTTVAPGRESLIDLDESLEYGDLSKFVDMDTNRASSRPVPAQIEGMGKRNTQDWKFSDNLSASPVVDTIQPQAFAQLSNDKRLIQEWKFPVMISSPPEVEPRSSQPQAHAGHFSNPDGSHDLVRQPSRVSGLSLIDLDESVPRGLAASSRHSTARSGLASTGSASGQTPFGLERHISQPCAWGSDSEVKFGCEPQPCDEYGGGYEDDSEQGPGDVETVALSADLPYFSTVVPSAPDEQARNRGKAPISLSLPPLPLPPSATAMMAVSSNQGTKLELTRLVESMGEHLQFTSVVLSNLSSCGPAADGNRKQ